MKKIIKIFILLAAAAVILLCGKGAYKKLADRFLPLKYENEIQKYSQQYGLDTVAEAVQDNGNNQTRFICISNNLEIYPGADKTSLMIITPHKPGALYKILSRFNALGINLAKLESRPLPDRNFEFMFYFDLEIPVYSERFAQLIAELEQECDDFTYLGTYSEVV